MTEDQVLDDDLYPATKRRRKLLPLWIKIFLWIFMVFGAAAPVGLVFGILGIEFNLSLYGLETIRPLSLTGLVLLALFGIKGMVSIGLWTEKDWAVKLAIFDAILGIAICIYVMAILPFVSSSGAFSLNLRLELVLLIPYLVKMQKIHPEWLKLEAS